jgi:regulator of RNase E activity RraA
VTVAEPKVGWYRPVDTRDVVAASPDPGLIQALMAITGLSSSVSDALDQLGYRMAVPASALGPVGASGRSAVAIGRVLTIRYLPLRQRPGPADQGGRLAHGTVFDLALPGDVLVISAPPEMAVSVLGGNALAAARAAGLAGVIADGSVRDVDELAQVGLPVWARAITPVSGRGRLEAVEINGPVLIGSAHVIAGDVAVADLSGISFIPAGAFEGLAKRLLGRG